MGIRERRLAQELTRMERLRQQSTLIDFAAKGDPPDDYLVTYKCIGMVNADQKGSEHVARIYLHAEYPRRPPEVSFLTPIFHPNIAAPLQMVPVQAQIHQLLASAHDETTRQRIRQRVFGDEDLFKARVCLDTLDLNWSPAITLDVVCLELGEMIQYKRHNPDSPLNHEAAEWARQHADLFPVDTRSLRDLEALEGIRILSVTPAEEPEVTIRIM